MDVVLQCSKSTVMELQNKATHHHFINQKDFYKAGQNLGSPACVLQIKLIYLKQESTAQAGWGKGMSYYLVSKNILAFLYTTHWCLHILVLQWALQTFLQIYQELHGHCHIHKVIPVRHKTIYLCCCSLEWISCLNHTYALHSKPSTKSCFLLGKIHFSNSVFYSNTSRVSVWHLPFPKSVKNLSILFLGSEK